jgi:hypothetical protein
MTDVTGLSIAIFDQLLKLGERTAQLISDARSFNEVGTLPPPPWAARLQLMPAGY